MSHYKVVIPNEVAKSCVINPGSHSMTTEQASPAVEVSMELLHVPVRSASQIIQKAVIGSHTLSIKRNRMETEGFHWDVLAREIRDKNYRLDNGDLLRFALGYGTTGNVGETTVSDQTRRIGLPTDVIDHVDQARIEPMAAFDAFLSKACAEINSLNRVIESSSQKKGALHSIMNSMKSLASDRR